jgi:phenylacetate-CoA ligase
MQVNYWNKEIETADRGTIEKIQLEKLKKIIAAGFKTPFYSRHFKNLGIKTPEDVKSFEDFRRLPLVSKEDLRRGYPNGFLAGENYDDVVRMHSSSGTTGIPTVIYWNRDDLEAATDLVARCLTAAGCTRSDIFQNMMSYGLFTGGLGLHYGAERLGMMVIPIGGGNTIRQINTMRDFGTTTLHITPSYLMHLATAIKENGIALETLSLKRAIVGAEPHTEETRLKLEEIFNIDCYNCYGLSEMNGPGLAFECVYKNGLHIWEDSYILEIIDPATEEQLPDGETGEVVVSCLNRQAMPLMRYRTRDLAHVYTDTCQCGRTHRRLSRIKGRTDDMLIINGVNVFPSQIEEVIMKIPEVGTNYMIHLAKSGAIDRLTVKVEIYSKMFSGDPVELDMLKDKIAEELRASIYIHPRVQLHEPGILPTFEGKGKRVVDERGEF